VAQELRRLFEHEDFAVRMYDPKTLDKTARVYSIQNIFSQGLVYAPDKAWAEMVIRQMAAFPRAKNDDLVDTVTMNLRHLRDIGLLTHQEEIVAAEEEEARDYKRGRLVPLYGGV
jgi:phage terminase large subunit-like protein